MERIKIAFIAHDFVCIYITNDTGGNHNFKHQKYFPFVMIIQRVNWSQTSINDMEIFSHPIDKDAHHIQNICRNNLYLSHKLLISSHHCDSITYIKLKM